MKDTIVQIMNVPYMHMNAGPQNDGIYGLGKSGILYKLTVDLKWYLFAKPPIFEKKWLNEFLDNPGSDVTVKT